MPATGGSSCADPTLGTRSPAVSRRRSAVGRAYARQVPDRSSGSDVGALRALVASLRTAELPTWLRDVTDPEQVAPALRGRIGALVPDARDLVDLRLQDVRARRSWSLRFAAEVATSQGNREVVLMAERPLPGSAPSSERGAGPPPRPGAARQGGGRRPRPSRAPDPDGPGGGTPAAGVGAARQRPDRAAPRGRAPPPGPLQARTSGHARLRPGLRRGRGPFVAAQDRRKDVPRRRRCDDVLRG